MGSASGDVAAAEQDERRRRAARRTTAAAATRPVDERAGEARRGEQAVPGLERRGEQERAQRLDAAEGADELHRPCRSRPARRCRRRGCATSTESRIARQVKPSSRRRPRVAQLATTSCSGRPGGIGLAGQAGQRLVADDQHAGDDRGRPRAATSTSTAKPAAVSVLAQNSWAAAGRAGQHGLPGAVLVLAGEDVAGDDRGQQRQHPLGGEAEDQQGERRSRSSVANRPKRVSLGGRDWPWMIDHDRDRGRAGSRAARRARAAGRRSLRDLPAQRGAEAGAPAAPARAAGRRSGGAGRRCVVIGGLLRRGRPGRRQRWRGLSSVSMKNSASSGVSGRGEAAQLDVRRGRASATYADDLLAAARSRSSAAVGSALDGARPGCCAASASGAVVVGGAGAGGPGPAPWRGARRWCRGRRPRRGS